MHTFQLNVPDPSVLEMRAIAEFLSNQSSLVLSCLESDRNMFSRDLTDQEMSEEFMGLFGEGVTTLYRPTPQDITEYGWDEFLLSDGGEIDVLLIAEYPGTPEVGVYCTRKGDADGEVHLLI